MKKYMLITLSIFLLSCNKGVDLNGTTWLRSDNLVRLEFEENSCYWILNPGDINDEKSHWDYNA